MGFFLCPMSPIEIRLIRMLLFIYLLFYFMFFFLKNNVIKKEKYLILLFSVFIQNRRRGICREIFSMKQLLQLNHHHLQLFAPPLNLKFRHGAFSPCEFFFPPPLSPSHSFSTLSFSSLSFNKTTIPSRLLTCNMNRNSGRALLVG